MGYRFTVHCMESDVLPRTSDRPIGRIASEGVRTPALVFRKFSSFPRPSFSRILRASKGGIYNRIWKKMDDKNGWRREDVERRGPHDFAPLRQIQSAPYGKPIVLLASEERDDFQDRTESWPWPWPLTFDLFALKMHSLTFDLFALKSNLQFKIGRQPTIAIEGSSANQF